MNQQSAMEIVSEARSQGRRALSEYEAKKVLAAYSIPVTRELLINDLDQIEEAVGQIGFPLVMKACCADIAHKTEKNLVRVDIRTHKEAAVAFKEISAGIDHTEQGCQVLIQEMVSGKRELVMGMTRDAQFGPCVMFGLGGIFTEVLKDIAFSKIKKLFFYCLVIISVLGFLRKPFSHRFNEVAPVCPDSGKEKRVSEPKLRLRKASEAGKLLFRAADQPKRLWIFLCKNTPAAEKTRLLRGCHG
jgi:hypothetical protein